MSDIKVQLIESFGSDNRPSQKLLIDGREIVKAEGHTLVTADWIHFLRMLAEATDAFRFDYELKPRAASPSSVKE